MFEINDEKTHPCPAIDGRKRGAPRKYIFSKLEIGQSFLVAIENATKARVAASIFKNRNPGWDYTARKQADGSLRIWRTA